MEKLQLSVSDFIALTNQTLEYAYPTVVIEGEVASFKINQGKYVFFDLKDSEASVGCFMMAFQLRMPVEDGMKVTIKASPQLTRVGKFSLTVRSIRPSGEGALKKSFELLRAKLAAEGLFASERKRLLPSAPQRIAVVSSTQAAGYADFIKICDRLANIKYSKMKNSSMLDKYRKEHEYFKLRLYKPEYSAMFYEMENMLNIK